MAIYHLEAKVVSRGSGRSAVAASAYLSCSNILNDYDGVRHDYEQEQMEFRQELESLAIKIQEIDMQEKCIKEFIEQAKAYVNPTELTPEMLRVFIRRIEVYEKAEKYSRTCGNPIAIYFTFQPKINTTPITLLMDVAEEECETAMSA